MRGPLHILLLLLSCGLVVVAITADAARNVNLPKTDLSAPASSPFITMKQDFLSLLRKGKRRQRKLGKRDLECRLVHKYKDKCKFVHENCEDEEVGIFGYLDLYYCKFGQVKAAPFIIMGVWLALLFMTIGIAASDFFCVNLSTIANILGMSESMAGVTFLAFGNGSPDVFSTFAAMKINSGSLAVGELIGAASFITAVVAGSMAIVRPFKVAKKSFVRDVLFFAAAVCFGIYFLWDGKITLIESVIMVCFYAFYVLFVVAWHWYQKSAKSRRAVETRAREHYTDLGSEEPEEEDEDGHVSTSHEGTRLILDTSFLDLESSGDQDEEDTEGDETETESRFAEVTSNMRISRPTDNRRLSSMTPIRPSLVGALEFRAILQSLEKDRNLSGRPIHLRSYSDDPFFPAASAPGTSQPGDSRRGARRPSLQSPQQSNNNLLAPSDVRGRTRAVSVGDATNPSNDPSLYRTSMMPSQASIAEEPGPPLIDVEVPTPQATRFTEDFDFYTPDAPDATESQSLLAPPDPHGTISPGNRSPSLPSTPLLLPSENSSRTTSRAPSVHHFTASPAPMSPVATANGHRGSLPSISLPDSSLSSAMYSSSQDQRPVRWWPYAILPPPRILYETLFPTLRGFRGKGFIQKALGIIAAPSVFFLTITLPVVEYTEPEPEPDKNSRRHSARPPSPTSTVVSESALAPNPEWANDDNSHPREWNRWLTAVQCMTAPIFIVLVTVGGTMSLLKPILIALLVGLVSLLLLLLFTSPDRPPKYRYAFCFVGFVVSIGWISTIAGEVVGVLKAFGVIIGMSDAILGLTIFAVGNSLGDLVADITVARLGFPVMALSACFGGPMLNILLGIGISGLYVTLTNQPNLPSDGFHIDVSTTLMISSVTLLATLVFLLVAVPMNKWRMTRRIGAGLVVIWTGSTIANVIVEVLGAGGVS